MVNPGRPSTGCLTCRRRRVKCDETRPRCSRCLKVKADCEWKDEWTTMLRQQEQWAAKNVTQRVERVQQMRNARIAKTSDKELFTSFPSVVRLARQPQVRSEVFAVERFYMNFAFSVGTCPFMYVLRPLYDAPDTPGCFQSIVSGVALCSAARQLDRYDLMCKAGMHYGNALRQLARSLSDPVVAKHDSILLTVYLLGLYEVIAYNDRSISCHKWGSHSAGRRALLLLRGREQLLTQSGRNLWFVLYMELLQSSLEGQYELLEDSLLWMLEAFPLSPVLSMKLLMHDSAYYLRILRQAINQRCPDTDRVLVLMKLGIALDTMLDDMHCVIQSGVSRSAVTHRFYASAVERRFQKESVEETTPRPNPASIFSVEKELTEGMSICDIVGKASTGDHYNQDPIQNWLDENKQDVMPTSVPPESGGDEKTYVSVTRAVASNVMRATHIHLLQGLVKASNCLKARSLPDSDATAVHMKWINAIEDLTADICHDIPYALGQVDSEGQPASHPLSGIGLRAYLSLWPMRTALSASQQNSKHREQLKKQATYMAGVVGIGMALHLTPAPCPYASNIERK